MPRADGLVLRPFEGADAPALIAIHRDATLRRFTRSPVDDPEGAAQWLTDRAFAAFAGDGLHRIDLLHEGDDHASCRVAEKSGYAFTEVVPAFPPYPADGHRHSRKRLDGSEPARSEWAAWLLWYDM
ncbi:GNAT family N-acetyltransferase [Kitasatospora sp. NPDC093550]|uniref:GNAT family N-acetyltransferase n=1 Tax=Kitasatospora sp. NPDC093550 TaxID=3364089 RepID=UPI0038087DD8